MPKTKKQPNAKKSETGTKTPGFSKWDGGQALSNFVAEYMAFSELTKEEATAQVARDEGTTVERVTKAVRYYGLDIEQFENE